MLAAALGCGLGLDTVLHHQQGVVVEGEPQIQYDHDTASGGALPPAEAGDRSYAMR